MIEQGNNPLATRAELIDYAVAKEMRKDFAAPKKPEKICELAKTISENHDFCKQELEIVDHLRSKDYVSWNEAGKILSEQIFEKGRKAGLSQSDCQVLEKALNFSGPRGIGDMTKETLQKLNATEKREKDSQVALDKLPGMAGIQVTEDGKSDPTLPNLALAKAKSTEPHLV